MSARRILAIILMTVLLSTIIAFILRASQDQHWGAGYWRTWLVRYTGMDMGTVRSLVFWLRKAIHFFGYAIFGILFLIYFHLWRLKRPGLLSIFTVFIIAIFDEWIQATTTFRSGQAGDVAIDLAGLLVGQWLAGWKRRRQANEGKA